VILGYKLSVLRNKQELALEGCACEDVDLGLSFKGLILTFILSKH
jgi:hypothetical protein